MIIKVLDATCCTFLRQRLWKRKVKLWTLLQFRDKYYKEFHVFYPSCFLRTFLCGAPGWLRQLSVWLLISTQDMISRSWDGTSHCKILSLPLSLHPFPTLCSVLSLYKTNNNNKKNISVRLGNGQNIGLFFNPCLSICLDVFYFKVASDMFVRKQGIHNIYIRRIWLKNVFCDYFIRFN